MIQLAIEDREYDKFVVSPSRVDKTAVEVVDTETHDLLGQLVDDLTENTVPLISNVLIPLANVETLFALPANCKGFVLKSRATSRIKISFVSGGAVITIPLGGVFEDKHYYAAQNIYITTDRNAVTLEIITYT